jgi:hypothetical protein
MDAKTRREVATALLTAAAKLEGAVDDVRELMPTNFAPLRKLAWEPHHASAKLEVVDSTTPGDLDAPSRDVAMISFFKNPPHKGGGIHALFSWHLSLGDLGLGKKFTNRMMGTEGYEYDATIDPTDASALAGATKLAATIANKLRQRRS